MLKTFFDLGANMVGGISKSKVLLDVGYGNRIVINGLKSILLLKILVKANFNILISVSFRNCSFYCCCSCFVVI